jgi:hypothetical protein
LVCGTPDDIPALALVASSAESMGDLAVVECPTSEEPTSEAWEVSILMMLGADGASQGDAYVEVDGASLQLSDDVRDMVWIW